MLLLALHVIRYQNLLLKFRLLFLQTDCITLFSIGRQKKKIITMNILIYLFIQPFNTGCLKKKMGFYSTKLNYDIDCINNYG